MKLQILLLFLFPFTAFAQKQNDNWYFGIQAGISFSTGTPVALTDNPDNIYSITSCVSDEETGKLLFYTDGVNVWNASHQIIDNINLHWTPSLAQRVLTIRQPGKKSIYYIFMCGEMDNLLQYAIVDMSGNGGKGAVVSKNNVVYNSVFWAVTGVKHAFNNAWWVITHDRNTDGFLAFYFDSTGISNVPVVSNVGHDLSRMIVSAMVPSHKGNYLAMGSYFPINAQDPNSGVDVFKFDNICGKVSDWHALSRDPSWGFRTEGVAFSPNDSMLYAAYSDSLTEQLIQYTEPFYNAPPSLVAQLNIRHFVTLRCAPDNKIYIAKYGDSSIDVINNPNATACNYQSSALNLGAGRYAIELPNFVDDRSRGTKDLSPIFYEEHFCLGDSTSFKLKDNTLDPDSLLWDFGDSATSSLPEPKHTYAHTGKFIVRLKLYKCSFELLSVDTLSIYDIPNAKPVADTLVCEGSTFVLTAPANFDKYLWSTGDTTQVISKTQAGVYSLKVLNGKCFNKDSITIHYHLPLWVELGDEYFICDKENELVKLDAGEGFQNYKWTPTGDTTQWIKVAEVKDYFVVVKDFRGCQGSGGTKVKRRCPVTVFFPNAFTPNGDGVNDLYTPVGTDVVEFSLIIYNRWGEKVFETNSLTYQWDGTMNRKPAQEDVYVYKATYKGYQNKQLKSFSAKGNITLLR